ncbi:hypothetical protein [Frankia gtarii]|uniref:hypothetical protein n=1 Tax=Frankia gtarii TaxID=2950102 RepID=UPI0021C1EA04|nr:hypothetical protein [Frankia gtarii]
MNEGESEVKKSEEKRQFHQVDEDSAPSATVMPGSVIGPPVLVTHVRPVGVGHMVASMALVGLDVALV